MLLANILGNAPFLAIAAFIGYVSFTCVNRRSVDAGVKDWDLLACHEDDGSTQPESTAPSSPRPAREDECQLT